jgi:hypothetical protein
MHPARGFELLDPSDVDGAPRASLSSRREADAVADVIDRSLDAIDPAEAQGFFHRLEIRDARPSRALLVVREQQLLGVGVVLLEPGPERCPRGEELRFHWCVPSHATLAPGVSGETRGAHSRVARSVASLRPSTVPTAWLRSAHRAACSRLSKKLTLGHHSSSTECSRNRPHRRERCRLSPARRPET